MVMVMELAGMVGGGRVRYLLMTGFLVWVLFTFVDLYAANFSAQTPIPVVTRKTSVERHLLNEYEHAETNNTTTKSNIDGFEEWWSIQKQLKKQIQKTCKKFGPSLRKNIKRNELMYDPQHELLFCRNAKVGTTTWLTHFLQLSTVSESEKNDTMFSSPKLHRNIPPMFPVPEDDLDLRILAKSTTSFSMVRHPFERLVSAYQDKIVDGSDPSYFNVKHFIIQKYGEVTFPNFIRLILYKSKTKCRSMNTCRLDKHWKPYISRCAFCDIPYRVIARAETFLEDQLYIGQLAGVQLEHVESHHSSGGSTRDLARQYFGELDRRTVDRLYALYQVDFEMFGYSPNLYLSYARPSP